MMTKLSNPSRTLAAGILSEKGFEDRLVGATMTPMAGTRTTSLYSFKEAVDFLSMDNSRDLLHSRHASLGYLDLNRLMDWIRDVFGDTELSDALEAELPQCENQLTQLAKAGELMKIRLTQCETLVRSNSTD